MLIHMLATMMGLIFSGVMMSFLISRREGPIKDRNIIGSGIMIYLVLWAVFFVLSELLLRFIFMDR